MAFLMNRPGPFFFLLTRPLFVFKQRSVVRKRALYEVLYGEPIVAGIVAHMAMYTWPCVAHVCMYTWPCVVYVCMYTWPCDVYVLSCVCTLGP